jgi:hypothetical protein
MLALIPQQVDFDDYRDVDGVKMAFTVRVAPTEVGNPLSTRTYSEVKLNVPVDESKFGMPARNPRVVEEKSDGERFL